MKALIYYLHKCTFFVLSLCAVLNSNNLKSLRCHYNFWVSGLGCSNMWFCLCFPRQMGVKWIIEHTKAKVCLCFAPLEISMRALSALQRMISKRGGVMSRKEKYCWHAGYCVFFYRLGSFYVFEQESKRQETERKSMKRPFGVTPVWITWIGATAHARNAPVTWLFLTVHTTISNFNYC